MTEKNANQFNRKLIEWLNKAHQDLSVVMYDIGARYGIHYLYTDLLNLKNFKAIGFEIDENETANLRETQKTGMAEVWPYVIAQSKANREIYITKHPSCSSLYPPNEALLSQYSSYDFFKIAEIKTVDTISLDEFIEEHRASQPDFLKIDVQGAEYEVLQGGCSSLQKVLGVFLETQLREIYMGAPLFPDIHVMLSGMGFRLIFCEYNGDLGGEIVEFDAAYVRDVNSLSTQEDVIKSVLFCSIHKNIEFAANLIRRSSLSTDEKKEMLSILERPLDSPKMLVDPKSPYIRNNIELRQINEAWWKR